MCQHLRSREDRLTIVFAALSLGLLALTTTGARAEEPAPVKIGIVTFLTGPVAAPFGIPDHNAAELLVDSLNAGKVPAPYNQIGLGGAKIDAKFVDEVGSAADVVTQFRNLSERDHVDAVVGYVSSGNCLAVTPVAEGAKTAHGPRHLRHAAGLRGEAASLRLSRQPARDHG